MISSFLKSWHDSLENPKEAQEAIFKKLLYGYQQTGYRKECGAERVTGIEEFRASFPVAEYKDLLPLIEQVMQGDFGVLLSEPPIEWAMTRGTTGESKFVPVTDTDLKQRMTCSPRALLNYVYRNQRYDILDGYDLNLNFPSVTGKKISGGREITYGYSSGIYAKHSARSAQLKIVPEQHEIDSLGGGITEKDWENRFDLAYEKAKDKRVTMVIGVAQTMLQFGSYLKKRRRVYPKDIWDIEILVPTSIAGIHTKYKPSLRGLYGNAAVVEIYGATEGLFAQQLDDQPYVVPNYDAYFFEVETKRGIKMLYELKPGEYGSLVVSSCLFPRYKIGDLIKCTGINYYCVIGRDKRFTLTKHLLGQLLDF